MTDHPSLRPWLRATALGWLLGIPLLIILALIGESMGVGGTQVFVGLGVGTGVGIMQGRVIGRWFPIGRAWRYASAIGVALPFLVTDLAPLANVDLPYSLPVAVAAAGLVVGIWQGALLRTHVANAFLWIPASVVGWSLAGLAASFGDRLVKASAISGLAGALLYLGLVACGGVVLGAVTGITLQRLKSR